MEVYERLLNKYTVYAFRRRNNGSL